MYAVEVSDQIMIAHSFRGEVFGPAQRMHGATFVVRAAFLAEALDANGIVVDIGCATEALATVLAPLKYRNLDDLPQFKGVNTTMEFLTRHVFDRLAEAARAGRLGRAGKELDAIRITVSEIAERTRLVRGAIVKDVAFAVPGDLATPTGGYSYDRHIIAELRLLGWQVDVVDLGAGFPRPNKATLDLARARLNGIPEGRPIVIDGLAFGVIPEIAAELSHRHTLIALVHHPLALESGLSAAEAEHFRLRERAALTCTQHVIVTSPATARLVRADYFIASEGSTVTVVVPGNERRPLARGSGDGTVSLLAVGSVVPRKGYDVLVAALAKLQDLPWRLTIAGDRTRDPAAAFWLDAEIRRRGLDKRIDVVGAAAEERLGALYEAADVFVLASRFEGYGMAFADAIAHGLPVVGTTAGAIPETVPGDAGLLVEPDDAEALAAVLRRLLANPNERAAFAAGARAAGAKLPTWPEQAVLFARALDECR